MERPVADFPASGPNPVLLYFLESTARGMAQATGGSPFYIRNRIREAVAAAGRGDGSPLEVAIVPFAADPNRGRMGGFADLTLRLRYDEGRPDQLLELSADAAEARRRLSSSAGADRWRLSARTWLLRSALPSPPPAVAQDGLNDYPTKARADYVFACMATNGQTRDMLGRCSCSIDMIATILPYDGYVAAETVLRMRLAPANARRCSGASRRRRRSSPTCAGRRPRRRCSASDTISG